MANDTRGRILRVIDDIHDNTAGNLSPDALAHVAATGRFHFHRVSEAMVQGCDALPISAASRGYADAASFGRACTESYGTAPGAFRTRGGLRLTSSLPPPLQSEPDERTAHAPR